MAVSTEKNGQGGEAGEALGLLTPPEEGFVPFDGNARSVELAGEVSEHQLVEEVYEHLGDRDAYQVTVTGDRGEQQVLWVLGDADMDGVRGVVDAHVPDPDHGLDEEGRALRQLRERLASGEDLPASDLNRLLRAML